jgi:hypothetical protein
METISNSRLYLFEDIPSLSTNISKPDYVPVRIACGVAGDKHRPTWLGNDHLRVTTARNGHALRIERLLCHFKSPYLVTRRRKLSNSRLAVKLNDGLEAIKIKRGEPLSSPLRKTQRFGY